MPGSTKGGGRERTARPATPPKTTERKDAPPRGLTYKDAGVDIDAKMRAIQRIRLITRGTFKKGVLTEIGSFGGPYDPTAAGPFRRAGPVGTTAAGATQLNDVFPARHHKNRGMVLG